MVELRDVSMQFEEKPVLDGVNLTVEPSERLVVMGQSGSGKSTILRLVLGILNPNAGSVFFKQFEINRLTRRKLQQIRRRIGMVYQKTGQPGPRPRSRPGIDALRRADRRSRPGH
jgi:phospholipid/cholesterol/gamma-HCH transport system ATP-binding protein